MTRVLPAPPTKQERISRLRRRLKDVAHVQELVNVIKGVLDLLEDEL